jgi:hypothetical protein
MDRTDEVIYLAGLPGVPRMILWVKIRIREGVTRNIFFKNTVFCIASLSYMPRHCCRAIIGIGIPHMKNFVKGCPHRKHEKNMVCCDKAEAGLYPACSETP